MATLYSINDKQSVSIYLYKDIMTNEWIRYQIIFEETTSFNSVKIVFNEETAENELVLECCIEPETSQLLKDIYAFLNFEISSLKFEPIDEKEFLLSAIYIDNKIKVELILRYRGFAHKIIIFTNENKFLLFAKELQTEYEALINGKHGLVKNL